VKPVATRTQSLHPVNIDTPGKKSQLQKFPPTFDFGQGFGKAMEFQDVPGPVRKFRLYSTPPLGNVLFVLAAITKQSFEEVSKQVFPYLLPILAVIVLCIFFPSIITFLPRLMH
jgi:hypothetical protein